MRNNILNVVIKFVIILFFLIFQTKAFSNSVFYTNREIEDLSTERLEFKVVHTSCDVLAKQDSIEIFVRKGLDHFSKIYQYDPVDFSKNPILTVGSDKTININIDFMSEIIFQENSWGDYKIVYKVEKIISP